MRTARILVVDDDSRARAVLARILEDRGTEIIQAADGAQALQELLSSRYDLVVTDLIMPNLDGLGLIEKARGLAGPDKIPLSTVPFILCTSNGGQGVVDAAMEMGFTEVLFKPIGRDRLLSAAVRALAGTMMDRPLELSPSLAALLRQQAVAFHTTPEELLEIILRQVRRFRLSDRLKSAQALEAFLEETLPLPFPELPRGYSGENGFEEYYSDS
jgi:CheY-like chemotaxis protein